MCMALIWVRTSDIWPERVTVSNDIEMKDDRKLNLPEVT